MEDRFFTQAKLEKRTRELEKYRFLDMQKIEFFEAMEDMADRDHVHNKVPDFINTFELKLGDYFTGRDKYLWLKKEINLPEKREGCRIGGYFDFGKTGAGHNSGFESLLYVNRKPYQGVDSNHEEVLFYDLEGKKVELVFMLWTGLEGGGERIIQEHKIKTAQIGYLHNITDEFYYYSKGIVKTTKLLSDESIEKHDLLSLLNKSFLAIDFYNFYNTVGTALEILKTGLSKMKKNTDVLVSCVGHTHIDVAWLWRLKHTREKAIRSFTSVLHLMEEFEEYIFLQSQPQLYDYIKEDSPELFNEIKQKVQENKWEIDGGMWLEADCNISSGESLARQFLYGIRFFKNEFNKESNYLWLPDVFGYSWALPQIMKLCNIKSFVTTKISWNQYNTMPDDLFIWRGIDGTEVLTYFITTPEIGHKIDSRFSTYNGMLSPRSVMGAWKKFRNKNISKEVLISYGFGDGGGGVNRNMLKMRRVMDEIPGLPNVKTSKANDFLERAHKSIKDTENYVHTWDGELYLEYHRGTYTSQANNKKWNRKLEFFIAETEWLSSLSMILGGKYEKEKIYSAWKTVLRNQFHDIIPGSSIREVYEDSDKEYEEAFELIKNVKQNALMNLMESEDNTFSFYHSGSFKRKETVFVSTANSGCFFDNGELVESQKTNGGYYVLVELEPFEIKTLEFVSEENVLPDSFKTNIEENITETPFYIIKWNQDGQITRIFDKEYNREVLNGLGNNFEIFEDKPMDYEAWEIDIFYTEKKETPELIGRPELIEKGNLIQKISFKFKYNNSEIESIMVLYKDSRRIDFETKVNWNEAHKLVKTSFDTSIRTTKAAFDIQYGYVERPTHFNTSWDIARFEVVGHKWADMSEGDYGVSLLNNCKYGYNAKDNKIKLSLLKSAKFPDFNADMGKHEFTYSLLPHKGNIVTGNTIEESVSLNLPIGYLEGKTKTNNKIFRINSENIGIDAIKKAEDEDAVVIRMHELKGCSTKTSWSSDFKIKSFNLCNILEENYSEELTNMELDFSPFEIKNLKIYF